MFYALPDGIHDAGVRIYFIKNQSDYSFFTISEKEGETYYGIACFRQIPVTEEMKGEEGAEKRGFIQKSVIVLSKIPLFNYILAKLNITTHVNKKKK